MVTSHLIRLQRFSGLLHRPWSRNTPRIFAFHPRPLKPNTMGYRSAPNKLKRPLNTEERQLADARTEALYTAWNQLDIIDYEGRFRVRAQVEAAHPLSPEVHEVWSREQENRSTDVLKSMESALDWYMLKPDAPWGLAIYRTAYGDDAAWNRMLDKLQETVENMQYEPAPGPKLFLRHRFEIMDDRSQFDGATIDSLCDKFRTWAVEDLRANCKEEHRPSAEELKAEMEGKGSSHHMLAPRYNFFLLVDDICLESLDQPCGPVVKIVQRGAGSDPGYSAEEMKELEPRKEDSEWEGGVTESEFENVGWMYMDSYEYISMQNTLENASDWEDLYFRPPQMMWQDGFKNAPGSWRK